MQLKRFQLIGTNNRCLTCMLQFIINNQTTFKARYVEVNATCRLGEEKELRLFHVIKLLIRILILFHIPLHSKTNIETVFAHIRYYLLSTSTNL